MYVYRSIIYRYVDGKSDFSYFKLKWDLGLQSQIFEGFQISFLWKIVFFQRQMIS